MSKDARPNPDDFFGPTGGAAIKSAPNPDDYFSPPPPPPAPKEPGLLERAGAAIKGAALGLIDAPAPTDRQRAEGAARRGTLRGTRPYVGQGLDAVASAPAPAAPMRGLSDDMTDAVAEPPAPDNRTLLERPIAGALPGDGTTDAPPAPLSREQAKRLRDTLAAMTPEDRALAEQAPGWRGAAAKVINKQIAADVKLADFNARTQGAVEFKERSRDRTPSEFAQDAGVAVLEGLVSVPQLVANVTDVSGPWAEKLRAVSEEVRNGYTPQKRYQAQQMAARLGEQDGEVAKFGVQLWNLVSNPTAALEEVVRQAPLMAAMIGSTALGGTVGALTVRGAGAVAPRVALADAIGGGALTAGARTAGALTAGSAAGATAAAGDAAGGVFEQLMDKQQTPDKLLLGNPDVQDLLSEGKTLDEARKTIATGKARLASLLAAPLGALSGRTGLESVIAGSFKGTGKRAAATELTTEVADELSTQAATNVATGAVDPRVGITDGFGQVAATSLVTVAPMAALSGYLARQPASDKPVAPTQARTESLRRFDELAAQFGLDPRATQKVKEQAGVMPADDVPGFLARATEALGKRGLFRKPVDEKGISDLAARMGDAPEPSAAAVAPESEPVQVTTPEPPLEPQLAPAAVAAATAAPVEPTELEAAAHEAATSPTNDRPEPTQAQKDAGNYKLGRARIAGLDISIENPEGSVRRGTDADGNAWETPMRAHYGYFRGTTAADGDKLDVFVKPATPPEFSGPAFVVDQVDPKTGKFDEHKIMLGYESIEEAEAAYRANYADGWNGLAAITALPMPAFKAWSGSKATKKPLGDISEYVPDAPVSAEVAARPADGGGAVAGGSQRDMGPVAADALGGVAGAATAPVVGGEPVAPVGTSGDPDAALTQAAGPRVIARAGRTPNAAAPLELRANADGTLTPWHEGYALTNYDSGEPIVLAADVSDVDAKKAIRDAGALSKKINFFPVPGSNDQNAPNAARSAEATAAQAAAPAGGDATPAAGVPAAGGAAAVEAVGVVPADAVASKAAPARKEARAKGQHPKTVMGSPMLAAVSEALGGLDPAWLGEFSTRFETKAVGKDGRPRTQWRNPMIPGIGKLFRKGGTQDLQLIAEALEARGYLEPGSVEADATQAGERAKDLIRAALNRQEVATVDDAVEAAASRAEREADDYYAELDAESAREAEAERQAIMAEVGVPQEALAEIDDDVLLKGGHQDEAALMRALGFSEQEIADELAGQEAAAQPGHQEGAAQDRADGSVTAGPPVQARSDAPGDRPGDGQEEGLTSPTPEGLEAAARRSQDAEAADRAEQKRLANKARADAERGEFTLTGSDRPADVAAAAGQGDIFAAAPEPKQKAAEPRPGKVGDKLAAGEVVLTASGRATAPFPKVDVSTNGKANNTVLRVNRWLIGEALAEAQSRGDTFNERQFQAINNLNPSQADKDSAEEYLFGEQPPVVPSILNPLTPASAPSIRPEAGDSEAIRQAKADALKALGDLSDILGSAGKAFITPEQEQKLLPVLTRLMDAAFRLGYLKFKQAAKFALDQIRAALGDEAADAITLDHLQGAYIGMAGRYRDQGADGIVAVGAVTSKGDIEAGDEAPAADPPPAPAPAPAAAAPAPSAMKAWDAATPATRRGILRSAGYTDADQVRFLSNVDWNQLTDPVRSALEIAQKATWAAAPSAAPAPAQAPVAEPAPAAPSAPVIVEHVTGKGKTLRGVVRTDLTADQAKTVDAFTFKKNGGYFIREKHLAELDAAFPTVGAPAAQPVKAGTLADSLFASIAAGQMPADNNALRKLVEAFDGQPADPPRMKQAQEALEAAIVRTARDVVARKEGQRSTFDILLRLYESQPLLNVRTSTSIANQAYSTPAPLAFLASELAGVTRQTTTLEPTAGTGMLLIGANPEKVQANELNDDRAALLRAQGFEVTQDDASAIQRNAPGSVQRVVTNPPFGGLKDANGNTRKEAVDGYRLGQIDHLIAARALSAMQDDGGATLILGANKMPGGLSNDDLIFFNWLYSHYNVVHHFEVSGELWRRQGAEWPVRIITIKGRRQSSRVAPSEGSIQRASTWDEVYGFFEQGLAASRAASPDVGAAGSAGTQAPRDPRLVPVAAGSQAGGAGGSRPAGGQAGAGNVPGGRPGVVGDRGAVPAQPVGERAGAQRLDGPAAGSGAVGAAGDAGRPAARQPAGDRGAAGLTDADNQFQTKYVPRSARKDEGVLIPVNMAGPTQDALNRLEDVVGDIDAFAARELGYASVEEMHDALMGLQVDAIASAIYQMKERSKGVIIADQTGIGKGRQAAAIIRWAKRAGHVPVFVTVKPSLFTDMYGDLRDIGTTDVAPFIVNSAEWIKGENDERLFTNKPASHRRTLERIASTASLPDGTNAVFMTYSQINVDNVQRRAIMALAERAVFILDESHNAGGESNTGEFIKGALDVARGVTYLSATYAKRPDNMPVYFKTDMGDAVADDNTLMSAMAAGGLPLQTVVSNNLVKAGQMFRRERSYDGVSIETVVDTGRGDEHRRLADAVTDGLRAIVRADKTFHTNYVKELQKQLKEEGKRALDGMAGNQAERSVDHTQFSSVVHNFVRQLLLGLKAQAAADRAIANLKVGVKPLIAVENTMGSFLSEYAEGNGVKVGDPLGDFSYRTVLSRALERSRYIVEQDAQGNKARKYIPLSALDPVTLATYEQAQAIIDAIDLDIPVSPIDWMRQKITEAGYTVAEITGRNLSVDYANPKKPRLSQIDATEQRDKVRTTRQFNGGKLDAIILNVAGSTGISLHASEKFKDQRPRKMIVAQPAQDINIFMQMLGRVHRTGQVALPSYDILNVDLPAEKRPTALLSKKMKSLNANTSSNTESATSVKAADMLNKYGDQIVGQYLRDNPQLADELGLEIGESDDGEGGEDIARKATGRLALMPVTVQEQFYADVEEQYNSLIEYLNKTNQNDLEPRTFDFDARELKAEVMFEGQNPESPFGEDAVYGEYSIKAQGKPMIPAEIREEIALHLGGQTPAAHAAELDTKLNSGADAWMARLIDTAQREQAQMVASAGKRFIAEHKIGSTWRVDINGDTYNAIVTNLRSVHKGVGNPYSLSKFQVTLAVNGALRSVTVPGTQFDKIAVSGLSADGQRQIDGMFGAVVQDREVAKIITGNLLGAYGELTGVRGSVITFTKQDGSTEQGILLPKTFVLKNATRGDYRLRSGADAFRFLQEGTNPNLDRFGIMTRDQVVRVTPKGRGISIAVPKSKAKGGRYFLDAGLLAVVGDFTSSGSMMRADVMDRADAVAALDLLMKKQALYALPSMAAEAKTLLGSDDAAFSRAKPAPDGLNPLRLAELRKREVQRAVDAITSAWANAPETIVLASMAEAPEAARRANEAQLAQGADGEPAAFVLGGKVYIVARQMGSTAAVAEAMAHEALGHLGLRGVFGSALNDKVLRPLAASMPEAVAAKAAEYGLNTRIEAERLLAAEEVLAELAQTRPSSTWVQRAIAAIRNWLRENIPALADLKLTDGEVIARFIEPARKFIERGNVGESDQRDVAMAFTRSATKDIDANIRRGAAAMNKVLVEKADQHRAMFRNGLGWVDFVWGDDKRGIAHIVARRMAADGMSRDAVIRMLTGPLVDAIAKGGEVRRVQVGGSINLRIDHNGYRVALVKNPGSNAWLLSGFEVVPGNEAQVAMRPSPTQDTPTLISRDLGAGDSILSDGDPVAFQRTRSAGAAPAVAVTPSSTAWVRLKARAAAALSPERVDTMIYTLQDRFIDLKRVEARIRELGGVVDENFDAYLGEELFHGRLAKRVQDFQRNEVKPLVKAMTDRKVSLDELEQFLHARHAPERNAEMAKRNPSADELDAIKAKVASDLRDAEQALERAVLSGTATAALKRAVTIARNEAAKYRNAKAWAGAEEDRLALSGMSDAEAAAIMAGLTPEKRADLEALAARVDAMIVGTRQAMIDYGLDSRAAVTAMEALYPHYVPLHRDEVAQEGFPSHPVGSGFSVRGPSTKRAMGSTKEVTNIIGHLIMQREAALTRGEKNRVAQQFYTLAAVNPDPQWWSLRNRESYRHINPKTGLVEYGADPRAYEKDTVFMARFEGEDYYVHMNEDNPQAVRLAGALKNLDMGDLGWLGSRVAAVTRYFAQINTQYNPVFGLVNFTRDLQGAIVNLTSTPLAGRQAAIARGTLSAVRAIYREERGKKAGSPEWARLWEDFQSAGGKTGFRDLFRTAEERTKALEAELRAGDRSTPGKVAHAILEWLSHYNDAIENGVRLSAYKVGIDSGLSRAQAASIAKNLTVNFNRKGHVAREAGSLYAFFNAAVQGTARLAQTVSGPRGRAIVAGGITLGAIVEILGRGLMDDDEWEKIPDFVKERALVIPTSGTTYATIPMPLGLHVLPSMGRLTTEAVLSDNATAASNLARMTMILVEAFNPIGTSSTLAQTLAPTVADPFVALWENRDWTGRPIARENVGSLDPKPGHQLAKDSASPVSMAISRAVNAMSGGEEFVPGAISWSPDQIDYVFGVLTGGLGREALKTSQTVGSIFTGDELPTYRIPLVSRFVGSTEGVSASSDVFYENLQRVYTLENQYKGLATTGRGDEARAWVAENPAAILGAAARRSQARISRLRDERARLQKEQPEGWRERVDETQQRMADTMTEFNRAVAKRRQPALQ